MAQSDTGICPPPELRLDGGNARKEWQDWLEEFDLYLAATGALELSESIQVARFKKVIGKSARDVLSTLTFDNPDDRNSMCAIKRKLDEYFSPRRNRVFERFQFWKCIQDSSELIDSFVTKLRLLAKTCEFGDQEDSLIVDRMVLGTRDARIQERLLREPDLDIAKATALIRAIENTSEHVKIIQGINAAVPQAIEAIDRLNENNCNKCGRHHKFRECPAYGQECNFCHKLNHFESLCRQKTRLHRNRGRTPSRGQTRLVHDLSSSDAFIGTIHINETKIDHGWWKTLEINDTPVRCKLDTGAETNVMGRQMLQIIKGPKKLMRTADRLTAYGNNTLKPTGTVSFKISLNGFTTDVQFYVIEDSGRSLPTLLGLKTCIELKLVKRIDNLEQPEHAKNDPFTEFQEIFEGRGQMPGDHHIVINKLVRPVVHAPRRVPLTIEPKLKELLTEMEKDDVIVKRDEPTDWVSSLLITEKKNGSLRICLDPRDLNKAIQREHFHIPTCDDILKKLSGMKVFTIIDMKDGFWQVKLDEESSKLCTFNTPFGRYSMKRLPFGIKSAPEVFQKKTTQTFGAIDGVQIVFDDLIIATKNELEHDDTLRQVFQKAKDKGIKFNKSKIQYKVSEVRYLGHILSKDGVRPDENKVKAITEMPTPKDKAEVQRLLGMITYLGKFIPNLSSRTDPLRMLLKKDIAWHWNSEHDKAIADLKRIVASATQLAFFDQSKIPVIQTDASGMGLGSCLMQEGVPIAYASRSLSDAEKNYAQIEKELLAIVFACEKFGLFIYGRKTIVHSDHKPLESIFRKPIFKTTPRLQRMLTRLLRYDLSVEYLPGKHMLVADALSRAYVVNHDGSPEEIFDDKDTMIHLIASGVQDNNALLDGIRNATASDTTLTRLIEFMRNGFPTDRSSWSPELKQYYKIKADIYEHQGIVYLHEKIIVPDELRPEMLGRIHEGHLGTEKCKKTAQTYLYWPGMSKEIEDYVSRCNTCNTFLKRPQKEPLMPHPVPNRPWQKIGADIFQHLGKDFLILTDYYSKYPEIHHLRGKTAADVITGMKSVFARHGIPEELMADNMPFASQAMQVFAKTWGFKITTSSPEYPQSNGLAERSIQTIKNLLKKAQFNGTDPYLALLQFRNAPITGLEFSPAQLLMSRALRTRLPSTEKLLNPKVAAPREMLIETQKKGKEFYDRTARMLTPIKRGDVVRVQRGTMWEKAVVENEHSTPRSYIIRTGTGSLLRRNRRHLVKTNDEVPDCPSDPIDDDPSEEEKIITKEVSPQVELTVKHPAESPINSPPPGRQGILRTTRSGRVVRLPVRFQLPE